MPSDAIYGGLTFPAHRLLLAIRNSQRRQRAVRVCALGLATKVHNNGDLDMSDKRNGNGSGIAPEPIRGTRGASILGPRNIPLEIENPDLLASPETDSGTIPNLKFSYAAAR